MKTSLLALAIVSAVLSAIPANAKSKSPALPKQQLATFIQARIDNKIGLIGAVVGATAQERGVNCSTVTSDDVHVGRRNSEGVSAFRAIVNCDSLSVQNLMITLDGTVVVPHDEAIIDVSNIAIGQGD